MPLFSTITIPVSSLPSDLDEEKAYYVYCRSGARSAAACAHMRDMGFEELYNLKGGILDWNGPVVKP